jgi:hypothetical protein
MLPVDPQHSHDNDDDRLRSPGECLAPTMAIMLTVGIRNNHRVFMPFNAIAAHPSASMNTGGACRGAAFAMESELIVSADTRKRSINMIDWANASPLQH